MIAISSGVCSIVSFFVSLFWIIRAASMNSMNDDWETFGDRIGVDVDTHAYDLCAGFAGVEGSEYIDICGSDENCIDEVDTGWHHVFEFNAVVLFMLFLTFAISSLGACFVYARLLGAFCFQIWSCCHLICILVTASYRWSKQGRLCSLVEEYSDYKGDGEFKESWTYSSDANAMVAFWVL